MKGRRAELWGEAVLGNRGLAVCLALAVLTAGCSVRMETEGSPRGEGSGGWAAATWDQPGLFAATGDLPNGSWECSTPRFGDPLDERTCRVRLSDASERTITRVSVSTARLDANRTADDVGRGSLWLDVPRIEQRWGDAAVRKVELGDHLTVRLAFEGNRTAGHTSPEVLAPGFEGGSGRLATLTRALLSNLTGELNATQSGWIHEFAEGSGQNGGASLGDRFGPLELSALFEEQLDRCRLVELTPLPQLTYELDCPRSPPDARWTWHVETTYREVRIDHRDLPDTEGEREETQYVQILVSPRDGATALEMQTDERTHKPGEVRPAIREHLTRLGLEAPAFANWTLHGAR